MRCYYLLSCWLISLKITAARRFQCDVVQSEEEIIIKNGRVLNIFQISANCGSSTYLEVLIFKTLLYLK